jgi:hypothetical protein
MDRVQDAILDPSDVRITRDDGGRLLLRKGEEERVISRVIRSFPLTKAFKYISLWDEEGEIGLIEEVKDLDATSQQILREELERAYFMPRIKRLIRIRELYGGITEFDVETDRGFRQFSIPNKNSIRHVSVTRILITDADGNKYEVPDTTALDSRSRSLFGWLA